jgi:transcriptional regulator GlxA family with amidase domain
MTKTIGILLFDEFEELDAVGPWEVLSDWTRAHPDDDWRVLTFADSLGPVTAAKGLRVLTDTTVADLPALDVLVYPGGRGTRPHLDDDARLDWVRRQRETVPLMTSVCTGSLVYAAAGLLEGRRATTHWGSIVLLGSLDPTIDVRPDDRFVDDGDVITSAGVSAGIDMRSGARRIAERSRDASAERACERGHLVARLGGVERARQVRRGIQYDPQPPVRAAPRLLARVECPPVRRRGARRARRDRRSAGTANAGWRPRRRSAPAPPRSPRAELGHARSRLAEPARPPAPRASRRPSG